jgi:hypothetical protein
MKYKTLSAIRFSCRLRALERAAGRSVQAGDVETYCDELREALSRLRAQWPVVHEPDEQTQGLRAELEHALREIAWASSFAGPDPSDALDRAQGIRRRVLAWGVACREHCAGALQEHRKVTARR